MIKPASIPDSGRYPHRFIIETALRTSDAGGGFSLTWHTSSHFWGAIETLSGRALLRAGKITKLLSHRITTRHTDAVNAGQRVRLGARIFTVNAVIDPDGRRRITQILCEEEAS